MNQAVDLSLLRDRPALQPFAAVNFESRFATLGTDFYSRVQPAALPAPHLIAANAALVADLGLAADAPHEAAFQQVLIGNQIPAGATPLAAVYAGHQFGVYVPQLGDGRALSLGEIATPMGMQEVQLKGAGKTPYSRMGDGRAVLRSSIREYLCSEAMHGLGIPTTRALALMGSDQPVIRETVETAAVVTRIAPSFVRFGSFEFFYHRRQADRVRQLADFVIGNFYPNLAGFSDQYERWFAEIVKRTASMIAQWQAVGFCHGVMNTDNMSILGLTIDYGPFGFLEAFDPGHICNHSDDSGRYAYNMQPQIGLWNLYALGQALVPLMEPEVIEGILKTYQPQFEETLDTLMRQKLGLATERDGDDELVSSLFTLMAAHRVDFTLLFRNLAQIRATSSDGDHAVRDLFIDRAAGDAWLGSYRTRLRAEDSPDEPRATQMNRVNPKYVLRNWIAEKAIRLARGDDGAVDFSAVEKVRQLLAKPFDEQPENAAYAALPPDWANGLEVSCSS